MQSIVQSTMWLKTAVNVYRKGDGTGASCINHANVQFQQADGGVWATAIKTLKQRCVSISRLQHEQV